MKNAILALLETADMSGAELKHALKVRHETLYAALAQLEAEGRVSVWGKVTPNVSLWCKTEVLA